MSLFPAYTFGSSQTTAKEDSIKTATEKTNHELSWLNNTSYPSVDNQHKGDKKGTLSEDNVAAESCADSENIKSKHKKKKKDKKKKSSKDRNYQKTTSAPKIYENDDFYEDKKQERGNLQVNTLYRPAVPRYNKDNRYFKKYRHLMKKYKKKNKVMRYFVIRSNRKEVKEEEFNSDPNTAEGDLTRMTEEFNKRLADDPGNVEVWLSYVHFQDTVYDFENTYRKNSIGGERVTSERKLAILDRAIQNNPASERLIAERLTLAESTLPADQLAEECVRQLTQDPGNLHMWRALIRTTRNSMARCTAPGVLQTLSKAIRRIGLLRTMRPPASVERNILALLLESGLFLQQAGLWEQLWTLLQMYLSLSLTASGQFDVPANIQEDKLREQEDSVMASGLPLSVLWLRVEKLRAACHFLPSTDCDSDPQRVVFSDDLAGLLQPVMCAELRLQLVVTAMVLLKVPLLPTRHSLLACLGLLDIPSAINNVETLLGAFHVTGIPGSHSFAYLTGSLELISEPQCVREGPGQAEYLSWLLSLLTRCADLLPPADCVVLHTWSLRLYGLLCRLHTLGVDVPASVIGQARAHAKKLLKLPQFRDNLMLFAEYAEVEVAAGDLDKACKVLQMAASMRGPAPEPDIHHTLLCRKLAQCLLTKDYHKEKDHAVRVLTSLLGSVSPDRWEQHTTLLVDRHTPDAGQALTVAAAMTPQPLVEALACQAQLLALTRSVWDATALLQKHIEALPQAPGTLSSLWVEQLYEVMVDMLHTHTTHSRTSYALLRNTLVAALKLFPNNLSMLNTLATIETGRGGGGTPLWKLVSFFPPSAPLARLILVFVVRYRISRQNSDDGGMSPSGQNYLRNLLRQLTAEQTTRECPLVWRLQLHLLAAGDTPQHVKAAFYKCLQVCPWVKAFYLDAVKFLPEELAEIQDLMIEKELRLHTTPEELEILRD